MGNRKIGEVVVERFSVDLLPVEKLEIIFKVIWEDYPYFENKFYSELVKKLGKYFPDLEKSLEKCHNDLTYKCPFAINGNCLEWIFEQLQNSLQRKKDEITCEDVINVYENIKEYFFRYIANHYIVNEKGYINSMLISSYKKACKLLINENCFEKLIIYTEGLRNCEGILKKEFLQKYRTKSF